MKAKALRFYVSNTDVFKHESVYESITHAAIHYGLTGATVYRAVMGYGASNNLLSERFWEFNTKVPIVVEIIDEAEKIDAFLEKILPWIEGLPKGCLVTSQDVDILLSKKGVGKL